MMKFLQGLNELGKINVVNGFEEFEFATHSNVATIDLANAQSVSRIINFKTLFCDIDEEYGLVMSKDDVMFKDGSMGKLKDVFSKIKKDTRKIKPTVMDFVEIQNCFNGDALITVNKALALANLKSLRGMVKEIKDDIYTVVVGGEVIKLPSVCLKKIPRTIMGKSMRDIYEFMLNKGRKILILPEYNYMDISEDGKFVKYIATDRLDRFEGKYWDTELRGKLGTQKKIRGVLKALFDCSDEEMDSVIMLYGNSSLQVEVLEGKDVVHVFDKKANAGSGSLGNSCMLGKPKSYFEIYEDNAKVAIVKDDKGVIVLRALIWELYSESQKKKIKIMDRIYSKSDSMIPMMLNWAMKNNIHTLKHQQHSGNRMVTPKGAEMPIGDYHIKLKKCEYKNHPYIDTFYLIAGSKAYASGYILSAHSTGGNAGRV